MDGSIEMNLLRAIGKVIMGFFSAWAKAIEDTCPNCGHYCNNSTVFCNPPQAWYDAHVDPKTGKHDGVV